MPSSISKQIKLPLSVAVEVVMQGIRIRLGRSVVTITGVVCGIAFFMSILTGQIIKKGVAEEDAQRENVSRILSFVASEMPVLQGKKLVLLGNGSLDETETRVLETFLDTGVEGMITVDGASPKPIRPLQRTESIADAVTAAEQGAVIFVMGEASPQKVDWSAIMKTSNNVMVGTTLPKLHAPPVKSDHLVLLSRELTQEELDKKAVEARKSKFRSIWITVVSLLVTVIGITNAMLMSVTERFREIGTMKCLGALSGFIRRIFILESSLMGFVGGLLGALLGAIFSVVVYMFTYGPGLVFASLNLPQIMLFGFCSVVAGVILSVIAALYPARVASNMVPATALRSTV